jgi:serine/threonine protein kinase
MKEFVAEAKILASVNHPNVVRLLGLMKDPEDGCFYIVTEFVAKGLLQTDFDMNDSCTLGSLMSILKNPKQSAKLTQGVLLNMYNNIQFVSYLSHVGPNKWRQQCSI